MSPPLLDFRSLNSLWGSVIVETLARSGVRQAVISPGSRSTPLVFAFARHPEVESIPVLDERSAAFFALGLARQHLRPVALVCTSGTAGANYFPAVIEAHESGVPLLILTADRPPEMRACASGQTIDQQKLFGGYVAFHHELALPEATLPLLRYLRQTVAHARARASHPAIGPVHLNIPFRDPLHPTADGTEAMLAGATDWEGFFAHLGPLAAVEAVGRVPELAADVHGLIVAGPAQPRNPLDYAGLVGEIAGKLGWPVLADALSPARNHAGHIPNLITTYDPILRDPATAQSLLPEVVL
jgi:2-succinyl-5-enolpyruvyl-6-hydroxy-3-cyclohexene-1-carboxylate synthase